jgi:hypothetical protein
VNRRLGEDGFCLGLMSIAAPYAWADQVSRQVTWRQLYPEVLFAAIDRSSSPR